MKKNSPETTDIRPPFTDTLKGILKKIPFCAIGGWMLFAVAVVTIGYYILFPARGYFHADCADTILWAQAAYDGGGLLNPDFHYACFLPIGGQLLMLPFIPLFGVSMTTHTIGMMLFLLLFAAALLFLFRQLTQSTAFSAAASGVVLLILAGSDKLREIFYGHVIYYSLGMLFLIVSLGLVFKLMCLIEHNRFHKPAGTLVFSLLCVTCLLGAINQFEILTLFSIPLIGALIAERFCDFQKSLSRQQTLNTVITVSGAIAATAFGYLIGAWLVGDMHASYAEAFSTFSDPDIWFDNFSKFLGHYLTLFGTQAKYGVPFGGSEGIFELVRIIAALAVLIVPIIATVLYGKLEDRLFRVLIWAHWIVTALIMMGFVFGHLSIANWRVSPLLCTSTLVTLSLCHWCLTHRPSHKRLLLIAVAPIALVLFHNTMQMVNMPPDFEQDTGLYAVVDTMKENGWTHGYATFWNAGKLTVISDSAITCRNIELSPNADSYEAYDYQSNVHWFKEDHEEYFVLLETAEYNRMVVAGNPLISNADSTHTLNDDYVVLVFDENIV